MDLMESRLMTRRRHSLNTCRLCCGWAAIHPVLFTEPSLQTTNLSAASGTVHTLPASLVKAFKLAYFPRSPLNVILISHNIISELLLLLSFLFESLTSPAQRTRPLKSLLYPSPTAFSTQLAQKSPNINLFGAQRTAFNNLHPIFGIFNT
jgi:hypothetical protein